MPQAAPAVMECSATRFSFPAVDRKIITSAFDGDRLTSDGGALLLARP